MFFDPFEHVREYDPIRKIYAQGSRVKNRGCVFFTGWQKSVLRGVLA